MYGPLLFELRRTGNQFIFHLGISLSLYNNNVCRYSLVLVMCLRPFIQYTSLNCLDVLHTAFHAGLLVKTAQFSPITTDEGNGCEDSEPCLPSTRDTGVRWRECSSVDDYMKRCGTLWAGRDERKSNDLLLSESLLDSVTAMTCRYKLRRFKKPILVRSTQFPPAR
jgi:hypothetical protein